MTIRPLTADDAPAFKSLSIEGIRLFPQAFLMTEAEALATPTDKQAARLASGGMHGTFQGAQLIGFAGLEFRPWEMAKHRAHIGPFYVSPAHQGQGVAGALMGYLVDLATARGVTQLELWVAAENSRARAFYGVHGFQTMGRMPAAVIYDGTALDDFFMVRNLADPPLTPGADGLRRLVPGDWREFRDIRLEALRTSPRSFGSHHDEWAAKAPDEVADWLRKLRIWGVVRDGRILANAGWHPMSGAVQAHRGHVIAAYTRPDARGEGYFGQLMNAIVAEAKEAGISQLELDVGAENQQARAAYEAQGFAVTGGIPRALNHEGYIHNQLYMIRPL